MRLYELTRGYATLLDMLENPDTDNEEINKYLGAVEDQIEVKVENTCKVMKNLEAEAGTIKKEEDRLRKRRQSLTNRAGSLKKYIESELRKAGLTKLKSKLFTTYIQNNPPRIKIKNENLVPDKYIKTTRQVDKTALMDAIKAGEQIEGVSIVQGESLRIR